MGSIPPGGADSVAELLVRVACETAATLGLPWDLQELKKAAYDGAREATRSRAASLGLSQGDAQEHFARKRAEAEGELIRKRRAAEQSARPSDEQIEAALEECAAHHWGQLAKSLRLEEANHVLCYLDHDDNRPRLIARFGSERVYAALGATAMRAIELERADDKTVAITDAYWAVQSREQRRLANREGEGHPSKGRSLDEEAGDKPTASRLSKGDKEISPYQVGQWRKHVEKLSEEQFRADKEYDDSEERGRAFAEYWATIHSKRAYKEHQREHGRRE